MACTSSCAAMVDARQPRVLLIDDDPSLREIVSALLAFFGYDCQTAADGPTGLRRFDEGRWDLVLTDLAMPEVSGWDVIEAIRTRAPSIPIVLLTGSSDESVMRRASESHVVVIPKPFHVHALKTALIEALYSPARRLA